MFVRNSISALILSAVCLMQNAAVRADQPQRIYDEQVIPFLKSHCLDCHGSEDPAAKLDLSSFRTIESIAAGHQTWEIVLHRLESHEMPPKDSPQPTEKQRAAIIDWIRRFRRAEAERHAGDPGLVLVRRLSNAEYNYTIRDITGVDLRPTATFPIDPANEAGFDNSGESLTMSPALLNKYLGAARHVVEHAVLTPTGIDFAPHPVVTETDRDKYCVKRIVQFYERQPTDLNDYFYAAYRLQQRLGNKADDAEVASAAVEHDVSTKYFAQVWELLHEEKAVGPIARLQAMFKEPPTTDDSDAEVRRRCAAMRDFVVQLRAKLVPPVTRPRVEGVHQGSQPFVLWRNRQRRDQRRLLNRHALIVTKDVDDVTAEKAELAIPADEAEQRRHITAFERFCAVFPDAFYVSERGRDYVEDAKKQDGERGRLLSAGFHSMMGYFRDDGPLYDLILDDAGQRELDELWRELDFVASAPMRQYVGFLWFERTDSRFMREPQFDFARPENKASQSQAMIERLARVYLEKVKISGGGLLEVEAVVRYFDEINNQIHWVEKTRQTAEKHHVDAMLNFAADAFRRPLSIDEQDDLRAFYTSLRRDELSHDEAIEDTLVAILMSPDFTYRLDLMSKGNEVQSLTNYELASRLSYFLWSSGPDATLLATARRGELTEPKILIAQTKRMLQHPRVRGMAVEFGGNWLDFRRFNEHNSVDRKRFPTFNDDLRSAMFEEPVRFFMDAAQHDRPILDFMTAKHTFVNRTLAKHYGIPFHDTDPNHWVRVPDASQYHRGGVLPMSVFLTKNAPGLRTSPVKRGYWVVRRLLGERIPPPPPNVPELPEDESKLGDLTLRDALALHRKHKACAGCHDRFDAIGVAFEAFGPIGERRERDLGGRDVVTTAKFPGAGEGSDLAGLRQYLQEHRQREFIENLCRQLLSYALGRSLILSDDLLVEKMQRRLNESHGRFSTLIETIVTSPQFLNKRGRE